MGCFWKFGSAYSYKWQVFENSEFINFCKFNRKWENYVSVKRLMFAFIKKRQAGNDGKTDVIDWF